MELETEIELDETMSVWLLRGDNELGLSHHPTYRQGSDINFKHGITGEPILISGGDSTSDPSNGINSGVRSPAIEGDACL